MPSFGDGRQEVRREASRLKKRPPFSFADGICSKRNLKVHTFVSLFWSLFATLWRDPPICQAHFDHTSQTSRRTKKEEEGGDICETILTALPVGSRSPSWISLFQDPDWSCPICSDGLEPEDSSGSSGTFRVVGGSPGSEHRRPFWLFWSRNRWRFLVFTWWFKHLPGKPIYFP